MRKFTDLLQTLALGLLFSSTALALAEVPTTVPTALPTALPAEAINPPELTRLVRQDCGSCHGMTLQGGLGVPLTREALAGQSVDALTIIILHGKSGTAMPPWKTLLTEAEAQWIAARLIEGFPEETR